MKHTAITFALAFFSTTALCQQIKVTSNEGADMKFGLGYGIFINKDSTAKKALHIVVDEKSPVKLSTDAYWVDVEYKTGRGSSGDYVYTAKSTISSEKDLIAAEVLHSVFDIFGRHIRTLQQVSVADVKAGSSYRNESGSWRVYSESEASMAHSVFSYVSQAKFKDGTVYTAPMQQILNAIKKMSPTATEEQISTPRVKQ